MLGKRPFAKRHGDASRSLYLMSKFITKVIKEIIGVPE
jgi:hypothetical protein